MHWPWRVWALAGFLLRSNHKVGLQSTAGSSGGYAVLMKSSGKGIIFCHLLSNTLPKDSEIIKTLCYKKLNKQNGCGWVCIKLCPILFSPPSSCLAGHVSRKLLGFQRVTGVPRSQTVHEDLSNCLYSGTHTKITFTIRKYLQRSQELLSIRKSAAVDVCVRKDLRKLWLRGGQLRGETVSVMILKIAYIFNKV